mgnify:CR=1 FL=1
MTYEVKHATIVIFTDSYQIEISKKEFYNKILTEDILNELSFDDLGDATFTAKDLMALEGAINFVE